MVTKRLSFTSTNIYYHFIIETRRNAFQNIVEAARHMNIIVVSSVSFKQFDKNVL